MFIFVWMFWFFKLGRNSIFNGCNVRFWVYMIVVIFKNKYVIEYIVIFSYGNVGVVNWIVVIV